MSAEDGRGGGASPATGTHAGRGRSPPTKKGIPTVTNMLESSHTKAELERMTKRSAAGRLEDAREIWEAGQVAKAARREDKRTQREGKRKARLEVSSFLVRISFGRLDSESRPYM